MSSVSTAEVIQSTIPYSAKYSCRHGLIPAERTIIHTLYLNRTNERNSPIDIWNVNVPSVGISSRGSRSCRCFLLGSLSFGRHWLNTISSDVSKLVAYLTTAKSNFENFGLCGWLDTSIIGRCDWCNLDFRAYLGYISRNFTVLISLLSLWWFLVDWN